MTDLEIFHNAPENASPEQLAAYLDEACAGDAQLREKVEALLSMETPAVDFLSELPKPLADAAKKEAHPLPQPDGQTILYFGDYELQNEIARGAMGVVYRAEQTSLKRTVAIKMIRSTMLASEEEIARFRTEAEAAASLDHPNIVPIYEIGEHDGQQYFSMKLIEGGTLNGQLERLNKDPKAAAEMMRTIALAIHSAHQRGILHRDIKPGNILIDEQGEPHLTDFGLAKQIESESSMTLSGQIMGTPNYMAPEQAAGEIKELTTGADVYALGAIFYEMLTGQPPHRGESLMDTLRLVVEEEPDKPRTIDVKIDRDLETIALKCLAKELEKRYASAQGLANDLDLWLRGEPILARPVGTGEKIAKWMKRKPVHAAAGGLAALLLLTLGIGGPIAALRQAELREIAEEETERADGATQLAETRAEEIRGNLYASEMLRVQAAIDQPGAALRIKTILDRWRPEGSEPDLRGWEWFYARSLLEQSELTLPHPASAQTAAWSRDGKLIYTGCDDFLIRVWDAETGRLVKILTHHRDHIRSLAVSPGGSLLASSSRDGTVKITRLSDEEVVFEKKAAGGLSSNGLAWSPDGTALAFPIAEHQLGIVEVPSGKTRASFDTEKKIQAIGWSQDGERVAVAGGGRLTVFEPKTGSTFQWNDHTGYLEWDGQGNIISGRDRILEAPDFKPRQYISFPSRRIPTGAKFSRDHSQLVYAMVGNALLSVDLKTRAIEKRWIGHTNNIRSITWNPDGTKFVSAGEDPGVRIWRQDRRSDVVETFDGSSVAWHPKEEWLAGGGNPAFKIYEGNYLVKNKNLPIRNGTFVTWSPEGDRLVALSRLSSEIWEFKSGSFSNPTRVECESHHNFKQGKPDWEPNGDRILVPRKDSKVDLYSGTNGRRLNQWNTIGRWNGRYASWHPEGRRFAMANRNRVEIRKADTGELETSWSSSGNIVSLAWHPSGKWLATSNGTDFSVEIWSYPEGRKLVRIAEAALVVIALDWSPDGSLLAMGGSDGIVRFWSLANGNTVLSIEAGAGINDLDWDETGMRLAVAGRNGIRVFDAAPAFLAEGSLRALPHLDREIRADPEKLLPRIRKAELFEKNQRWQDAIAEWENLEKLRPDEKWISERRLAATLPTMEPEAAIALLENQLEQNPTDSHAARQLARLLFAKLPAPEWTVLEVESAQSREGADLATEADGSLFVSGENAETGDLYNIVTRSGLPRVASIRLEAIPDERLPTGGSGRANNGNFRLFGFSPSLLREDSDAPIPVSRGWTDYSAGQGDNLARILDENPLGHWTIGDLTNQRRHAYFDLAEVHAVNSGDRLEISLPNGNNTFHNLGRFRLSVTDRPHAARWAELQQALQVEPVLESGFDLLGMARSLRHEPEAAAEAFARALEQAETDRDRNRTRRRANQDARVAELLKK